MKISTCLQTDPEKLRSDCCCLLVALLMTSGVFLGCARAAKPGVYQESKGKIVKISARSSDSVIRVARFVRLRDGSVICPKLYYYQVTRSGFLGGIRDVEQSGRTYRTLGTDAKPLYLPKSDEISAHLLLVRRFYPKDAVPEYVDEVEVDPIGIRLGYKSDKVLSNWELLEVPVEEISPDTPFVFPTYEELATRELSEEQQTLLKELVQQQKEIAAAAAKRAATPVGQGS